MNEKHRSKIVGLGFICKEKSVLLVKQNYANQYWSLPGGYMEAGESIDQATIREVKEETGLDVRLKRVVGIYTNPNESKLVVTFEAEITGGEIKPTTNETSECRYFTFDNLPEPRYKHIASRLEDFLKSKQTVFRTEF